MFLAKVHRFAFEEKIPIVMLLSGGYQRTSAQVTAESIANLHDKFGILNKKTVT